MENYKKQILVHLLSPFNANAAQQKQIDKISEAISYAWKFWDAKIIAEYLVQGEEKGENPNTEFITSWLDNEDLDADGYNVDHLKDIFA